ncbi:MAG TPA: ABC transporter transmembrane domain-containing protein, partial [Cyclobacteriaceae bacterium]
MKTFLRILNYSPKIGLRLVGFFLFSILGIIFGAFNIVLVIPMLQVLFSRNIDEPIPPIPEFSLSSDYLVGVFQHYFRLIIQENGSLNALLFVCGLIVLCVLFANIFRFLERVVATKIRVDLVRNIRLDIFDNVSRLHIGFFNSERKGDLISRFTNDVQEIEVAVMNSLKAVL